jgi:hypothetical protein
MTVEPWACEIAVGPGGGASTDVTTVDRRDPLTVPRLRAVRPVPARSIARSTPGGNETPSGAALRTWSGQSSSL